MEDNMLKYIYNLCSEIYNNTILLLNSKNSADRYKYFGNVQFCKGCLIGVLRGLKALEGVYLTSACIDVCLLCDEITNYTSVKEFARFIICKKLQLSIDESIFL